ncbi:MAG: TonB-dependent receptor [Bacteroidales bacterium]|nr:TonB-dependent receptor [Bacteroidales bacterium]
MTLKVLTTVFLLLISVALQGQVTKYPVTWKYENQKFREFIQKAESVHNVKFFYKEEWISDKAVTFCGDSVTVAQVLDASLRESGIYFLINRHGDIILTSGYMVRRIETPAGVEGKFIPSVILTDSLKSRQVTGSMFIDVGNPSDRDKPGAVTLSGYVRDENTGEPIAGVSVFNQKLSLGTITNSFGFYSLSLPRGSHSVQFTFIGLKEKTININLYSSGEIDLGMSSVLIPLKEAVVSAQKDRIIQRFEVGLENISLVNLRLLPASLGESDIIKSVLSLPGVKVVGEGSSGFNVRGGSADQNLILLYGAPMYNSNHFFGFFSAVNSDIIRDVALYKGGIPARYGGRISSVLEITPKEGNRKEFAGNAGISPVTAHFMIDAPILKDKCSLILTGRSTYSNWIFRRVNNAILQNSMASFYDVNARLTYDINKNNKIETAYYLSNDAFRLNSDSLYKYDNNIVSVKWKHFFSRRFLSIVTVNNSNYQYKISSERVLQDGFKMAHKVNSTWFKADFNWYPEGRSEMNFGADVIKYSIKPGDYTPSNDSSLVIPHLIQKENAVEAALYFDEKYTITPFLSVNAGLRFSSYFALGPADIMLYDPLVPKNVSTITDTSVISPGRVIKTYAGPELRLSLNFRLTDNSSVKINYNRNRQYLHLLTNTTSISPTDTWKLSDYYLKPQIGDQYALGYYRMLNRNRIEASAEIYYKSIRNMLDFKGGARLVMNENAETEIINVRGRAYGLELSLKSTEGRLQWTAGYTYSRILIRSISDFREELVNSGKWFPASFDKPHDLTVTFNYLISRRFSFSGSYTYNTGRPVTYPTGVFRIGGITVPIYSERNAYRIPDYSRLDIAVSISGNLKLKKIAHPHWAFSVYNVLGRANVYSVYFRENNNRIKGYKLSVFGRPIPSVTYSFDF